MVVPSPAYNFALYRAANDNQRLLLLRKEIRPADVFSRKSVARQFGKRFAGRAAAAEVASALGPIGWIIDAGLVAWTVYDVLNLPGSGGGTPLPEDYDNPANWALTNWNSGYSPSPLWIPGPISSDYTPGWDPGRTYHPGSQYATDYYQVPNDDSLIFGVANPLGMSAGAAFALNLSHSIAGQGIVDGPSIGGAVDYYGLYQSYEALAGATSNYVGPVPSGEAQYFPGTQIINAATNANFQRMESSSRDQRVSRYFEPGTGEVIHPGDPLEQPGKGEDPWSRPNDPEITRQVVIQPGPAARVVSPTAPRPPRSGEKEKKARSNTRSIGVAIAKALDRISETAEVIDAIYEALPDDVKKRWEKGRKDRPGDQMGQYGLSGADWKLQALWHNWHRVDAGEAAKNILLNEIEDRIYGKYHKGLDRLTRRGQYRKANNV